MHARRLLQFLTVGFAVVLFSQSSQIIAQGETPAALTGKMISDAEGAMEGVVVSAKKAGSDRHRQRHQRRKRELSLPRQPAGRGKIFVKIRAIGYDLTAPASADVADEQTTTVDLKLRKTKNLVSQMSNAEWMMSLPGTEADKAFLLNCVGCHTLERIVRSTHDADEWTQVIVRMNGYGPVSQPIKPQRMLDPERSGTPDQFRKQGEYLARINLSEVSQWEYPLKPLPRPTGRATRVIITEYDMPRPTTEPHDVLVDAQGAVWYTDFGELFISGLDPKRSNSPNVPCPSSSPATRSATCRLEESTKTARSGWTPCSRERWHV